MELHPPLGMHIPPDDVRWPRPHRHLDDRWKDRQDQSNKWPWKTNLKRETETIFALDYDRPPVNAAAAAAEEEEEKADDDDTGMLLFVFLWLLGDRGCFTTNPVTQYAVYKSRDVLDAIK